MTDYKVKVTVRGYDRDALTALNIPVCSLQFYGNKKEFNVLAGSFGFKREIFPAWSKRKMHRLVQDRISILNMKRALYITRPMKSITVDVRKRHLSS